MRGAVESGTLWQEDDIMHGAGHARRTARLKTVGGSRHLQRHRAQLERPLSMLTRMLCTRHYVVPLPIADGQYPP